MLKPTSCRSFVIFAVVLTLGWASSLLANHGGSTKIEFFDGGPAPVYTFYIQDGVVVGGWGQGNQTHVILGGYYDGTHLSVVDRSHGVMGNEDARTQLITYVIQNGVVTETYKMLRNGDYYPFPTPSFTVIVS